ncbi:MAG TPA: class I SAM-dependent methyltransferase [Steroidobacteraceae bacterium]
MFENRETCPACGSPRHSVLHKVSYTDPAVLGFLVAYYRKVDPETIRNRLRGASYSVACCTECALIYQREIPDQQLLTEIYTDWVLQADELAPTEPPQPIAHYAYIASEVMHLLAEQAKIIGLDRRIRVLDFGMGWSTWLQVARSFGAEVFGAELSAPKAAYALSIGIPVLNIEQIGEMKFDLLCTEQVFEHVSHPAELLRCLSASLAPTGYLKISVPDGGAIKAVLKTWSWSDPRPQEDSLMPIHPLEHINCFDSRSLDAFASTCGLKRAPLNPFLAMAFTAGWSPPQSAVRNVLRPLFRFGLKRGTYAVYRHR